MIHESELDPSPIQGRRICVVGYGNQGRAHALNLRDRGLDVVVGTRQGGGRERATDDGFAVTSIERGVAQAELIVFLVPDEEMQNVYVNHVQGNHGESAVYVFAHGFAITYNLIPVPTSGAVLISPSGPGTAVRESFVAGRGLPAFIAAEPEPGLEMALAYAWAIGCARAGVVKTTFREETECDLFGEQTVLCGGMPELAIAAFETLVEAGYTPEVAYIECVQQVRLLADLMARYGVSGMKERISDTAAWGSFQTGPKVVNDSVRATLAETLSEIRSGEFARGWIAESASGKLNLQQLKEGERTRMAEEVFRSISDAGRIGG